MTPEGRKIWGSQAGQALMRSMLAGKPLGPQERATVEALKRSGPPGAEKPAGPATPQQR